MVDTHAPGVFAHTIPSEDSWEGVSQWSEQLQQESRCAWPKRSEISLPQFPRLEFVENNLEDLKELWENLALEHRTEFARAYGNIADLMYANISTQVLQALVHFWDPMLKCFTFSMFDLTPTIEEYQALIGILPCIGGKVYVYDRRRTLQRSLSKFLGNIHASDIKKKMKTKEGEVVSLLII